MNDIEPGERTRGEVVVYKNVIKLKNELKAYIAESLQYMMELIKGNNAETSSTVMTSIHNRIESAEDLILLPLNTIGGNVHNMKIDIAQIYNTLSDIEHTHLKNLFYATQKIDNNLNKTRNNMLTAVNNTENTLTEGQKNLNNNISTEINNTQSYISNQLSDTEKGINSSIANARNSITHTIDDTEKEVKQSIINTENVINNSLYAHSTEIQTSIQDTETVLKTKITGVEHLVSKIGEDFSNAMKEGWELVREWLERKIDMSASDIIETHNNIRKAYKIAAKKQYEKGEM